MISWFRKWLLAPFPQTYRPTDWIDGVDEDNDEESTQGFSDPWSWEPGDVEDEEEEDD